MRIKTFLFLILLITGVALSQSGKGAERMSFDKIIKVLSLNDLDKIKSKLNKDGYNSEGEGKFRDNSGVFELYRDSKTNLLVYSESGPSTERMNSIKNSASKSGLKSTRDKPDNLEMSGRGFTVTAIRNSVLKITKII